MKQKLFQAILWTGCLSAVSPLWAMERLEFYNVDDLTHTDSKTKKNLSHIKISFPLESLPVLSSYPRVGRDETDAVVVSPEELVLEGFAKQLSTLSKLVELDVFAKDAIQTFQASQSPCLEKLYLRAKGGQSHRSVLDVLNTVDFNALLKNYPSIYELELDGELITITRMPDLPPSISFIHFPLLSEGKGEFSLQNKLRDLIQLPCTVELKNKKGLSVDWTSSFGPSLTFHEQTENALPSVNFQDTVKSLLKRNAASEDSDSLRALRSFVGAMQPTTPPPPAVKPTVEKLEKLPSFVHMEVAKEMISEAYKNLFADAYDDEDQLKKLILDYFRDFLFTTEEKTKGRLFTETEHQQRASAVVWVLMGESIDDFNPRG